ncbi:MAG: hypothetical protein K0Q67_1191 [Cellvibrio sp.]|jgi:uncharacterized protein YecE (DUF72 family)|nr:hypothetical protein [Cellvibrio sp.]
MAKFYIGISGWRYAPWRNNFYPKGLVQKKELYFASRSVNSIEINGSFYALQTPERYAGWYADTPENFVFSVKAPRYITHIRRLNDVEEPIANFFASGPLELKEKLGAMLWQFPPSFKFNEEQFHQFLKMLPKTAGEALSITRKYHPDFDLPEQVQRKRVLRHAVEIRNQTFVDETFIALLRRYNVAFVIADTARRWPYAEDITSDFVYMRLHGDTELYRSGYSEEAIDHWYRRIKSWSQGVQPRDAKLIAKRTKLHNSLDVYCYFDNTDKLWAPQDARQLSHLLGVDKEFEKADDLLRDIAS